MKLFSGNGNKDLAYKIANIIQPLSDAWVGKFSDGEIQIEIKENVRGHDTYIIQPICYPTNDNLMELLLLADSLKRASARKIVAIIPYFGYSRQDRRPMSSRCPISARVIANLITTSGIDHVLTVDLHADQIQGFFNIPVDNLYTSDFFAKDILNLKLDNLVIVSPDVGGVVRARYLAKKVENVELVIIDKRRPEPNKSEVMNVIGSVNGKNCIIIDDMVDTASTVCKTIDALFDHGANSVRAYCTHPILSGSALSNFDNSKITELVVSDSIPLSKDAISKTYIRQLSIANILADGIKAIENGGSLKGINK